MAFELVSLKLNEINKGNFFIFINKHPQLKSLELKEGVEGENTRWVGIPSDIFKKKIENQLRIR